MKIDFTDVTFTIPIKFDSEDRVFNFKHNITFLRKYFDTNIIVLESDSVSHEDLIKSVCPDIEYIFIPNETSIFHRTKYLNIMFARAKTNIVVNYDVDVFLPIEQFVSAREKILTGFDFCIPYKGKCYDIPRECLEEVYADDKVITEYDDKYLLNGTNSLGGVLFFDKNKYKLIGWENENFISWGPEDSDRIYRINKLSRTCFILDGCLYHIKHQRHENSSQMNPFFEHNCAEEQKIVSMTTDELRDYISTWYWIKS